MCFVVREIFRDPACVADDIVIVALDDEWNESLPKPKMYITPELAQVVAYVQTHGATRRSESTCSFRTSCMKHEGLQRDGPGNAFALSDLREAESVDPAFRYPVVLPELFLKADPKSTCEIPSGKRLTAESVVRYYGTSDLSGASVEI